MTEGRVLGCDCYWTVRFTHIKEVYSEDAPHHRVPHHALLPQQVESKEGGRGEAGGKFHFQDCRARVAGLVGAEPALAGGDHHLGGVGGELSGGLEGPGSDWRGEDGGGGPGVGGGEL